MLGGGARPTTAAAIGGAKAHAARAVPAAAHAPRAEAREGTSTSASGASKTAAGGRGRTAHFDDEGYLAVHGSRSNSLGYARRAAEAEGAAGGTAPSWAERLRGNRGLQEGDAAASAVASTLLHRASAASASPMSTGAAQTDGGDRQDQGGHAASADSSQPAASRAAAAEPADQHMAEDIDERDVEETGRTPAELRQEWSDAVNTVKYLERRGGPRVPQTVLDGAKAHRDAAERAWRAAKPQHPLGKRIRWAAAELDEALEKQRAHRAELDEFDAEVERKRAELLRRLEVDEARTSRKREALDQLREEAGADSADGTVGARVMAEVRRVRPTMWAARTALEGIQTDVGPVLEQALEGIPEGTPTWFAIQGALSAVTGVHSILSDAMQNTDEVHNFDMAHDDSDVADSLDDVSLPADVADQGGGQTDNEAMRGHADERTTQNKRRAVQCANGGTARWSRSRDGGEGAWRRLDWADEHDAEEAAYGIAASSFSGGGGAARADEPRQEDRAGAASAAAEVQRNVQEAEQRRAAEAAAQRRQLEESYTPEQRAQAEALHAQQAAAAAAQFGTQQAADIARQVHYRRVDEVIKAAREKDIQADLEELRRGTPEELEDWARRHI